MYGHEDETAPPGPGVAIRVAAGLVGAPLVLWACGNLSRIWGYNDSGAVIYVTYSVIFGVPGLLLLLFAAGVIPRRRTGERDTV